MSTTIATDELSRSALVGQSLRQNVIFTHVSVHLWRGQRLIAQAEVTAADKRVNKEMTTGPRWKLLDETWQKRFNHVEGKLRSVVSTASPRFAIPGVYVIPRLRAREIFEEVDRLTREEFDPAVEEFVNGWDDYVAAQRAKASAEQWADIVCGLPTSKAALRTKFRVTKHVIPMAGGMDEELTGSAADDYAAEIQSSTQKFIRDTALSISQSLEEELQEAIDNLVQRIDDRGVVREGTLEAVSRALRKMESFSFVASPEVLSRIQQARRRVEELGARELNDDNRNGSRIAANGMTQALKAVRAEMDRDARAGGVLGRMVRPIDI